MYFPDATAPDLPLFRELTATSPDGTFLMATMSELHTETPYHIVR